MTCPNEGLSYLLSKYQVDAPGEARLAGDRLILDGKTCDLLPWRSERRIIELKGMLADGTIKDPCVLRATRVDRRNVRLEDMIRREFDIAEFLFDSRIATVYAVTADGALANIAARLDCGVVANFELAATLAPEAQVVDKHEIIASVGVALDKVVDTQIMQNSIYVYGEGKNPDAYTDVDFELYGLTVDEIARVRCAFAALKSPALLAEMADQSARLDRLAALALESAAANKKLTVEGR